MYTHTHTHILPVIIQEFLVMVDLWQKLLAHGYPLFHINLSQLVLDLDPVGIKFEILNQNTPNGRCKNSKFLAPPLQRSESTLSN